MGEHAASGQVGHRPVCRPSVEEGLIYLEESSAPPLVVPNRPRRLGTTEPGYAYSAFTNMA